MRERFLNQQVKELLIYVGLLIVVISIPLTVKAVRQRQIYLIRATPLSSLETKIEETNRMCDWDCTQGGKLVLYSKLVKETEVCPENKTVTKNGEERECHFLGAFLRDKEEAKKMCQKDWVICE